MAADELADRKTLLLNVRNGWKADIRKATRDGGLIGINRCARYSPNGRSSLDDHQIVGASLSASRGMPNDDFI